MSFELPVYPADDSLQAAVSPANSMPTDPVAFVPNVDDVPELGPSPHDQVAEAAEEVLSAAYSSAEFEVERICGQKRFNGSQHYLVKWVGFDKDPNDWIPVADLSHCQESIIDYWQRYHEGKVYRERKKNEGNKVKKAKAKTGKRNRKDAEMDDPIGEHEQKEELKEEEKGGAEKELPEQPPVNAKTESRRGEAKEEVEMEKMLRAVLEERRQKLDDDDPLPKPRWQPMRTKNVCPYEARQLWRDSVARVHCNEKDGESGKRVWRECIATRMAKECGESSLQREGWRKSVARVHCNEKHGENGERVRREFIATRRMA
ncbi:hypothetical protein niasHS_012998 [Heterodera schachtii]|uniref:Chromo domain-containing protein n=1 Tax=Heterodera schachtii TaxID=97005 RepID=A0ABD2IKL3_HETSC